MADLVDLIHDSGDWDLPALHKIAEAAARATLAQLGLDADQYELALLACDDARITALNMQFRGKPTATNVLSWPADDLSADHVGARPLPPEPGWPDAPEFLGDIAIAQQTCRREAQEQGKQLSAHLSHLVVHSVLHLLGYDHIRDKDAALMEEIEIAILASMGLRNPYESGAAMPL